jgi:two-component system, NtrC family, sensor kinase
MSVRDVEKIEWALRERVKELTCLYGIAQVTRRPGVPLPDMLQAIAELLPAAWQFPEIAGAQITLDDEQFQAGSIEPRVHSQSSPVTIAGTVRGGVEVFYVKPVPAEADTPFLLEEQKLIDMVALEVSMLVERREAEQIHSKLEEQLRHADRLATIGQLAAGVAHEINEPLANVLGFAQLARKTPAVPEQIAADLDKIVVNCLHAREVIQKLLTFAHQMPPSMAALDLNQIVNDGLYFLESRCAKAGIELVRDLDAGLPVIRADATQLHQVLINLVVNAIQAMPSGGKLTLRTTHSHEHVCLTVADTGVGMSEDVKKNIFTPFFTTKDVDEGTGLGLAVVHGIVTAHGGTIRVQSKLGHGATFDVELPISTPGGRRHDR